MRLLVVEDQKDLNEIIVRKLTNEHYSVDACYTGNDALDFIRCAEYDGIILDIMLPGITGIGVLREMRASGNNTPVLLLTAMGTVEDRVAGLDAGADDYLVKPFDFNELLARVRAIVRRGKIRAGCFPGTSCPTTYGTTTTTEAPTSSTCTCTTSAAR